MRVRCHSFRLRWICATRFSLHSGIRPELCVQEFALWMQGSLLDMRVHACTQSCAWTIARACRPEIVRWGLADSYHSILTDFVLKGCPQFCAPMVFKSDCLDIAQVGSALPFDALQEPRRSIRCMLLSTHLRKWTPMPVDQLDFQNEMQPYADKFSVMLSTPQASETFLFNTNTAQSGRCHVSRWDDHPHVRPDIATRTL